MEAWGGRVENPNVEEEIIRTSRTYFKDSESTYTEREGFQVSDTGESLSSFHKDDGLNSHLP